MNDDLTPYWYSRFLFERGLALIYLIAFIVVVNQFVPLLGERGLLPVPRFIAAVPFRASPSLFYLRATDGAFRAAGWLGILLSLIALVGLVHHSSGIAAGIVWASAVAALSLLRECRADLLRVRLGVAAARSGLLHDLCRRRQHRRRPHVLNWIYRWTLFRLMFGAGLIKLRGDACWRNLTCLDYYYETQPIPNALSWYFHWLPRPVLHGGVVFNHVAELIVPFGYFLPQPFAGIAGLITIVFQLTLIVSGNLSWLNWLTIVLAFTTLDDRFLSGCPCPCRAAPTAVAPAAAIYALGAARRAFSALRRRSTCCRPTR